MTVRVLAAKVGLDGHDRGIKVVARILRDAGIEVIYAGLRQTPATLTAIALEEDVDVVALSMHNGAHLTLAPAVVDAFRKAALDVSVVVGGIVPDVDRVRLARAGVTAVLSPGASNAEVINAVLDAAASRGSESRAARLGSRTPLGVPHPPTNA